jgi:hypothetical protein
MAEAFSVARPSWIRRTLFIASIAFHAVAAVGLLIWSVFHVDELPPPEVTLTFFNAAPPPPPPPPPAAAQKKAPTSKPKIVPVKNTALKEPQPPKEEPTPEPASTGGESGGVVGGVAGGVVGGVVGAPPTAAPPPPPAPPPPAPPKMVPSFVFDKERLAAPDPHLTDSFKDHHAKQSVTATYRICVGPDGRITEAAVIRGLGGTEDDAVINQLRGTWIYKPQPLPVCSVRNFVFNIR